MLGSVGIIGCGLIGGSIARDCIERNIDVVVSTKNPERVQSFIPKVKISDTPENCDLLIIATPLSAYYEISEKEYLRKSKVITDVGSVRSWSDGIFEKYDNFCGSHPVAGRAQSGIESSCSGLFKDRLVLVKENGKHADYVSDFWRMLGGNPLAISAEIHDKIYGKISHFTHIISFALTDLIEQKGMTKQDIKLISSYPEYKEFRRVGFANRNVWDGEYGIIALNKKNVSDAVDMFMMLAKDGDKQMNLIDIAQYISRTILDMVPLSERVYLSPSVHSMLKIMDINIFYEKIDCNISINELVLAIKNKLKTL